MSEMRWSVAAESKKKRWSLWEEEQGEEWEGFTSGPALPQTPRRTGAFGGGVCSPLEKKEITTPPNSPELI